MPCRGLSSVAWWVDVLAVRIFSIHSVWSIDEAENALFVRATLDRDGSREDNGCESATSYHVFEECLRYSL